MDPIIQQRCAEPFVASVEKLFRTMLNLAVEAGEPLPGPSKLAQEHARATIPLSGDVVGAVSLLMPEAASVEAVNGFVGKKVKFGSPAFRDAVGELANMIAGAAVVRISGLKIRIGCPIVLMGPLPRGSESTDAPVAVGTTTALHLPFNTEGGMFVIELLMTEVRSAAKAA